MGVSVAVEVGVTGAVMVKLVIAENTLRISRAVYLYIPTGRQGSQSTNGREKAPSSSATIVP